MSRSGWDAASGVDVAIVSSRNLADLGVDDRLLVAALRDAGISAQPAPWRGNDVDWSRVGAAVVRSTWDYSEDVDAFLAWVDHVSEKSLILNAPDIIRWNADKRYLRDLAERNVAVVPTRWIPKGSAVTLLESMKEAGWTSAVFKPVVSGGARDTHRVGSARPGAHPQEFARLLSTRDMMLQPYMERIERDGEISLIFVQGEYTHAVVKWPARGDYRVQEELGGSLRSTHAGCDTVKLARDIVEATGTGPLYARVDLVPDSAGNLCLMELELIEPELFLRFEPAAIEALVTAIVASTG